MTKEEVAARWPEAAAIASTLRTLFGDEVRLLYAVNQNGEKIGKPERQSVRNSSLK